jgi:DNA-binding NarL/FixJ family response regulator
MARSEATDGAGQTAPAARTGSAIAIVDPSRLRRDCLRLVLDQHSPDGHMTEAGSADELIHLVGAGSRFDLVLMGAATADHIDLRQIDALRHAMPDTPLVVVAETDSPQRARQILSTGARGFLPTSLSLRVLMGAIDLVLAGGVYVPSSLIESGSQRQGAWQGNGQPAEPWSELTRRQRDVLALISQGKPNKLIGNALTLSESTVKAHVKQIIKRLNVANRTQAALVATGRAFFPPRLRTTNGADASAARE